jgi:hypothetical protein
MSKFKVGDRVRVVNISSSASAALQSMRGTEGVIEAIRSAGVCTIKGRVFYEEELQLITDVKTEYCIALHTSNGDVRTCYPFSMEKEVFDLMKFYRESGKNFTVTIE